MVRLLVRSLGLLRVAGLGAKFIGIGFQLG